MELEASGATRRSTRYKALVKQADNLSAQLAIQTPTAEVVREGGPSGEGSSKDIT